MKLLIPLLLAGKNRVVYSGNTRRILFRDGVLILFAIFLMASIFYGTTWVLNALQEFISMAYLSPALPISMVLFMLFMMLIISNIVSAVGAFYLSEDLDLILASPIVPVRFFAERLSLVALSTSWISLIFMGPVIASYGVWFKQSLTFYLYTACALIPFFIIPAAISYAIATILVAFVPLKRSKALLFVALGVFLAALFSVLETVRIVWQSTDQSSELMKLMKIFSSARIPWLPSTWIGDLITGLLGVTNLSVEYRLLLLYGVAIATVGAAYLIFELVYYSAYSSMINHHSGRRYRRGKRVAWRAPADTQRWLALVTKDLRLLSRDMSQLFQGILLLGIYLIYIYNIRIFSGFKAVGPEDFWWRNFLFISNFCMSAFISCALCTRFVFPSISLEGRCFSLVLVKSPYTIESFVKHKFLFWYGVVATIHSVVVATGAFASGATPLIIIINILCSWIMCYGLVGLAIGMGGVFSRFDWESASQLAVGFGNIVFMLSAAALILFCMVPVWYLIFGFATYGAVMNIWYGVLLAGSFCVMNFVAGRLALKRGVKALNSLTD